jgi:predicted PurR-regulated permease PerM
MLPRKTGGSDGEFIRRVLIVLGIAALAVALYKLTDVVMLIFGSILVAVVIRALARPIRAGTAMSQRLALLASGFGIAALLAGIGYLFGAQIGDELSTLTASLPQAAQRLSQTAPGQSITAMVKGSSIGDLLMNAFSWGTTIFGAVAALVVVIVAGIYIAARPEVYRNGFVMLFPKSRQTEITDTIDAAGEALRLWLGAQLLAMIIVGILIAVGLAFVGVSSPLALGLIAGVAEFVPIAGPVIGAVPALLLASTEDWHTVAWTLVVFVVVQQIESNLIMPFVAGRAVALPPAAGLLAVVALGVLFGPLGLVLGYPLAIVIDVAVRKLYVRQTLGEKVKVVGEHPRSSGSV